MVFAFVLSSLVWVATLSAAVAHELRPAVADVTVSATEVMIDLRVVLEPLVTGMNISELQDTDDSPLSDQHDELRALDPAAFEQAFREVWPNLKDGFTLLAGETELTPEIVGVTVPEVGDTDLPRDSRLQLVAQLPPDGAAVRVGWAGLFGPLVIRQVGGGEDAYSAILQGGDLSEPLPREGYSTESAGTVFLRYIVSGFEHIIPKGLDHILFVLGLFFFSLQMRPLLLQVTAFTLAHTVTLALAASGYVSIPANIVEPLIALSIAFVAIENIRGGSIGWTRIAVVFAFGLLHGLGFASVLGDVGLQAGRFAVGLIGFNIGVELGQLAVILAAFLLLAFPFGRRNWYRSAIAVPVSVAIALVGIWWTFERVFLA